MKNIDEQIKKALEHVNLTRPQSIQEAANMALGLAGISAGSDAAVIDDPTHSMAGLKVKVKGVENGQAEVELNNGTRVKLLVNQLIAL